MSEKSREYFTPAGDPMDEEVIREREEEARIKKVCIPKSEPVISERELYNEWQTVLNDVNFETISEIFAEHMKRSGVEGTPNVLSSDRITPISAHLGSEFTYSPAENIIYLSPMGLEKRYGRLYSRLGTLHALMHEETHAVSKLAHRGSLGIETKSVKEGDKFFTQTGYQYYESRRGSDGNWEAINLFEYFNEGVVEKFSGEVFDEYLKRDPDFSPPLEKRAFKKFLTIQQRARKFRVQRYWREVNLVDALIDRISVVLELPKEVVWKSIVCGLLTGERFSSPEVRDGFAQIFSKDFLEKLRQYNSVEDEPDESRDKRYMELMTRIRKDDEALDTRRLNTWMRSFSASPTNPPAIHEI